MCERRELGVEHAHVGSAGARHRAHNRLLRVLVGRRLRIRRRDHVVTVLRQPLRLTLHVDMQGVVGGEASGKCAALQAGRQVLRQVAQPVHVADDAVGMRPQVSPGLNLKGCIRTDGLGWTGHGLLPRMLVAPIGFRCAVCLHNLATNSPYERKSSHNRGATTSCQPAQCGRRAMAGSNAGPSGIRAARSAGTRIGFTPSYPRVFRTSVLGTAYRIPRSVISEIVPAAALLFGTTLTNAARPGGTTIRSANGAPAGECSGVVWPEAGTAAPTEIVGTGLPAVKAAQTAAVDEVGWTNAGRTRGGSARFVESGAWPASVTSAGSSPIACADSPGYA